MRHTYLLRASFLSALLLASLAASYAADLPAVAGNTDIAAVANGGRIVSFSTEALDDHGKPIPEWQASNLIDGKYVVGSYTPAGSYGWSSQVPPTDERPEWVILAFTDPATGKDITRLISRIVIDPTTDDPLFIGRWVQGFTLQTSTTDPNGPWKTIGRYTVVNRPVKQTFDFPPTEARYVRLLVTSNHGSDRAVEMGEVEIYEAIVPGEQLDRLIIRLENLLEDFKRFRDGQLYQRQQQTLSQVGQKPPPEQQPGGAQPAHPAQPGTDLPQPSTPGAPAGPATPAGPPAVEQVTLGGLSLTIPPGWQRATDLEENSEQVKLFLLGPKVGEGQLAFTVSVEPVREGTTLADFATAVAGRLPGLTAVENTSAKLGDQTAHYLVLQGGDKLYVEYCLLSQGQGLILTAVMPPGTLEQARPLLQPLWDSVKLKAALPPAS